VEVYHVSFLFLFWGGDDFDDFDDIFPPPKTNMAMEHPPLKDVFPLENS